MEDKGSNNPKIPWSRKEKNFEEVFMKEFINE